MYSLESVIIIEAILMSTLNIPLQSTRYLDFAYLE